MAVMIVDFTIVSLVTFDALDLSLVTRNIAI